MHYETLSEQIKAQISRQEWLWLSPDEQARFIDGLLEPDEEVLKDDG